MKQEPCLSYQWHWYPQREANTQPTVKLRVYLWNESANRWVVLAACTPSNIGELLFTPRRRLNTATSGSFPRRLCELTLQGLYCEYKWRRSGQGEKYLMRLGSQKYTVSGGCWDKSPPQIVEPLILVPWPKNGSWSANVYFPPNSSCPYNVIYVEVKTQVSTVYKLFGG